MCGMSSIENTIIKLQGIKQLLIHFLASEGDVDNEMFLTVSDVINKIIEELESSE